MRPSPLEEFLCPFWALVAPWLAWGWILSGQAETLRSLYFWYIVGGIGAGIVYGGTIGNALKWFPDHRGLASVSQQAPTISGQR